MDGAVGEGDVAETGGWHIVPAPKQPNNQAATSSDRRHWAPIRHPVRRNAVVAAGAGTSSQRRRQVRRSQPLANSDTELRTISATPTRPAQYIRRSPPSLVSFSFSL